jgi:hypothetical protein
MQNQATSTQYTGRKKLNFLKYMPLVLVVVFYPLVIFAERYYSIIFYIDALDFLSFWVVFFIFSIIFGINYRDFGFALIMISGSILLGLTSFSISFMTTFLVLVLFKLFNNKLT